MTSWLCARIKANASVQIPEYPDAVLKGLVMKSDEFANIHILSKLGIERPHPAVWNFRRTETKGLPVFGVGQCHLQGILSRRAAACGRAELLAKGQHTDRLQNPAKLRRFRIGGGIGAG